MRAFNLKQQELFLNAFGQNIIQISDGATFRAIVECRPIVIEGSEGLIESSELYFTTKAISTIQLGARVALDINNTTNDFTPDITNTYTIYNIENDFSGMINYYFRME